MPRLKDQYQAEVHDAVKKELGLDNPMTVPTFDKIVVNMGLGDAIGDRNLVDAAVGDLAIITGQKPRINKSL